MENQEQSKGKGKQLGIKTLDITQLSMKNKLQDILTIYYCEKDQDWAILDEQEKSNKSPKNITSIKTLTYNIWFKDHHFMERAAELQKIMEETKPDFIFLQEVTERFQQFLTKNTSFSQNFYISGNKINNYGCIILSKYPITCKLLELDGDMQRTMILANCQINGQQLTLATTHLESLKENKQVRLEQLKNIFENLKDSKQILLQGDFNFGVQTDENSEISKNDFKDTWVTLKGESDLGNTHKSSKDGNGEAWRPDRVLTREVSLVPQQIELIGDKQIPYYNDHKPEVENEIQTPSDHLGILTTFQLKQ